MKLIHLAWIYLASIAIFAIGFVCLVLGWFVVESATFAALPVMLLGLGLRIEVVSSDYHSD